MDLYPARLWGIALRGQCGAVCHLEQIGERFRKDLGEPHKHVFVIAVVVGDVIGFRVGSHHFIAQIEWHLHDERIVVLSQAYEQFSFHFQGRRTIGSAFFDVWKSQPDIPNGFVSDVWCPLHWNLSVVRACSLAQLDGAEIVEQD